eukprot:COSAG01_NODE_75718_length_193_cov_53.808511_1_plen_55_part_01
MNYQSYREYSRIEQRLMALQAWHCSIVVQMGHPSSAFTTVMSAQLTQVEPVIYFR